MGKRLISICTNSSIVLISLLICISFLEIAARMIVDNGMHYHLEMWKYAVELKQISSNPRIGHEHVANGHARLMGVNVTTNSQGLRNDEVSIARTDAKKRILMLGDSVTMGWGVPQNQTVSKLLEQDLRDAGQDVEVINTGVGNYNTLQEVEYFFTHGINYKPDTVVLNYFINDAEPTPVYKSPNWIQKHSYAWVLLAGASDTFTRLFTTQPSWDEYYRGLYSDKLTGWSGVAFGFNRLADYCKQNSIRLIVVNYPELRQLKPYPFADINDRVRALATEKSVEYIDLLPSIENIEPATLWVTRPDPHPNANATPIFASAINDYLLRNKN